VSPAHHRQIRLERRGPPACGLTGPLRTGPDRTRGRGCRPGSFQCPGGARWRPRRDSTTTTGACAEALPPSPEFSSMDLGPAPSPGPLRGFKALRDRASSSRTQDLSSALPRMALTRARSTSELSTAGGPTSTAACAQKFVSIRCSAVVTATVGRAVDVLRSAAASARCGCSVSAARGVGTGPMCAANASSVSGSSPGLGGGVGRMATDNRSWPIERRPSACRLAVRDRLSGVDTAERAVMMRLPAPSRASRPRAPRRSATRRCRIPASQAPRTPRSGSNLARPRRRRPSPAG
jgi:hypothetical protein